MREGIHPTWYPEAVVTCACGNSWTTGSTAPSISTDVCSNCHPFYTGEQRIVDTEGQVDRFLKRLRAHRDYVEQEAVREEEATAPVDMHVSELEIGTRYTNVLLDNGIENAAQIADLLYEGGDQALLDLKGFGRKGLIDVKKRLRAMGYEVPEAD